jgi:plastocyanin
MGSIYIMTNPSFKEYVKIGYAADAQKRLDELNRSTAVPFAFRIYATYDTDQRLSDVEVHKLIDKLNFDLRSVEELKGKKRVREFYAMSAEDAYDLLQSVAKISGTEKYLHLFKMSTEEMKEDKTAKENAARKKRFCFSMIGLKPGDKVVFIKNKKVAATIVDDTHVQYGKETSTLSALAEKLLNKKSLRGPIFFTYEGRVLDSMRKL